LVVDVPVDVEVEVMYCPPPQSQHAVFAVKPMLAVLWNTASDCPHQFKTL
jgi:hypothetical protein